MAATKPLQRKRIRSALGELDRLARAEYGPSLEELLLSSDPISQLRVQRLVGVALKQKFAIEGGGTSHSATRAKRSWPWPDLGDSLSPIGSDAEAELALLEQLRMPGPWNERKPRTGTPGDDVPVSWSEFKDDAEHERGLFKIVALFAVDKFNAKETRTLKEYLDAPESKRFEAGLDLASLLFDARVITPLLSVLGVSAVAVGVALIGVQYGYRTLTDPNVGRVGDGGS